MRQGHTDECWPWRTGKRGMFWWRSADGARQHEITPRVAYRLTFGEIPADRIVAHSCDNRACCNPAHLACETQQKNSIDMAGRGLHPYGASERYRDSRSEWWSSGAGRRGVENGHARLTDEDVRQIRTLYASGGVRQVDLAQRYGVGQTTISRVVRRECWDHVGESVIPAA